MRLRPWLMAVPVLAAASGAGEPSVRGAVADWPPRCNPFTRAE